MIQIRINGQPRTLEKSENVEGLLRALGMESRSIAVAVNLQHIPRSRWQSVSISDGDEVEILSPQQGG